MLRCAQDAIIDLHGWTLTGPDRRQLRRALRLFDASGLTLRKVHRPETLSAVANAWSQMHGTERGHSMGRYCPHYLRHQAVCVAHDGQTPVAFVSFHTGPRWTLDLMRHLPNIPSGTMHALVHAGIEAARQDNANQLSLAAIPAPADHLPRAAHLRTKAAGLIRFKSAFAPVWELRYICARSWPALLLTMATLAFAIHRPAPLPASSNSIHSDHEDFSFAPTGGLCERQATLSE